MVKKGYCGNESLSLAWDRMEVCQINPFYTTIKKISTVEEIETFWNDIWGKKSNFNPSIPWFEILKSEYCKIVKQRQYRITSKTNDKVLKNLKTVKYQEQI